jgi:hypothetical protein
MPDSNPRARVRVVIVVVRLDHEQQQPARPRARPFGKDAFKRRASGKLETIGHQPHAEQEKSEPAEEVRQRIHHSTPLMVEGGRVAWPLQRPGDRRRIRSIDRRQTGEPEHPAIRVLSQLAGRSSA